MAKLSEAARRRLLLLRRLLRQLADRDRVTSRDLARWLGTTPDVVRKDLSGSGPGTPGAAYELTDLRDRVDRLLPGRSVAAGTK